jgi:hypothetical protein
MATRTRTPALDEYEDSTIRADLPLVERDQTQSDDESESDIGSRIKAALSSSTADTLRIAVYRRDPRSRALEFCSNYSPAQIEDGDLTLIRNEWGSGNYEMRIIGPKGIVARIHTAIANKAETPIAVNTNPVQVTPDPAITQALQSLVQSQALILQSLTQRPDEMGQMQKMVALMVGMRDAMGLNNPVAAVAPVSPVSQLTELMGAMKLLKEVAKETADTEPADPLMSMVPSVLELVKAGMNNRSQMVNSVPMIHAPESLAAHKSPALNNPGNVSPSNVTQPQQTEDQKMKAEELLTHVRTLVQFALEGKPAEVGGEYIYNNLTDDVIAFMDETPNWFDMLSTAEQSASPHKTWFIAAKVAADKLFDDAENEPEDSPSTQG